MIRIILICVIFFFHVGEPRAFGLAITTGLSAHGLIYNTCNNSRVIKGGGEWHFGILGDVDRRTGEGYSIGYNLAYLQTSPECFDFSLDDDGTSQEFDEGFDLKKFALETQALSFRRFYKWYFYDVAIGVANATAEKGSFFPRSFNRGRYAGASIGLSSTRVHPEQPGVTVGRLSIGMSYNYYKINKRGCITKYECAQSTYVPDERIIQYVTLKAMLDFTFGN